MKEKDTIIILHGWGLDRTEYDGLVSLLKEKNYKVFAIDMPGFGEEPLPKKFLTLDDYVEFVNAFLKKSDIRKAMVIGHSFGGRVAIKYAFKYPQLVKKIVLTGVPVIRHVSLKGKIASKLSALGTGFNGFSPKLKTLFRKGLYFFIGEWDYYNSGKLQTVFKNVIKEDTMQYLKKLKVPIILIWGENDSVTPVSDVDKIKKAVPKVSYSVVSNTTHRLPCQNPSEFVKAMEEYA